MAIDFQEPKAFFLLILLLPIFFLLWLESRKKIRVSSIIRRSPGQISRSQAKKCLLLSFFIALLVSVLAKPVIFSDRVISPGKTPNQIILLFDESKSAEAKKDGSGPSGLDRAKMIAADILPEMSGSQIAVYGFTDRYASHADFTDDLGYLQKTIKEVVRIEGVGGTGSAPGQAIYWLAERFDQKKPGEKIIILFSDGGNTAESDWLPEAPDHNRELGVRVAAVGVGEAEGLEIILSWQDWRGESQAEKIITLLDSAYLRQLAEGAGGAYFSENEISKLKSYIGNLGEKKILKKEEKPFPQDISGFFLVGAVLALAALWRYYR